MYSFQQILKGGWRLLCAKWVFRQCKTGRRVTARGFAQVDAQGEIVLGSGVKVWSHIHQTQLSAAQGAYLEIGEGTFINVGCVISARKWVKIGQNCQIANQVIIMDSDFHGVENRHQVPVSEPVIIEDNVWLATRCTILKGVRIGQGAVVAAGAVVTHDVPAYTLVGGVPAKVIRVLQK